MENQSKVEEFLQLDEFAKPSKELIKAVLLGKDAQLSAQLRALYFCRDLPVEDCTEILISALEVHFETFMRHEIAYVIGQSGCIEASKRLAELIEDTSEDPMVRHEAIEALGALKSKGYLDLIKKHLNDENRAVRHTCQLALHSLMNSDSDVKICGCTSFPVSTSPYRAIDPIPTETVNDGDLESLSKILFDESLPLYKRYEALYKIRGISGDEAARVIGEALVKDKASEVFRHECAFVLGQMQSVAPVGSLIECLKNENEEPMARHEAALALGACGCLDEKDAEREIMEALKKYVNDKVQVVSDSCVVAIDYIVEAKGELAVH